MLNWMVRAASNASLDSAALLMASPTCWGLESATRGRAEPAPSSVWSCALAGWSNQTGQTIVGTPEIQAAPRVPTPPWITRTEHFGKSHLCEMPGTNNMLSSAYLAISWSSPTVSFSSSRLSPAQPSKTMPLMPATLMAAAASVTIQCLPLPFSGEKQLPKPMYTGFGPASRKDSTLCLSLASPKPSPKPRSSSSSVNIQCPQYT
mmetsp:Transcript_102078/g.297762  ORF Transcript_102078/g.297762 Transcript_102078/m.297762 type:complete len:205 (-) Transcript_102078:324-938(-)